MKTNTDLIRQSLKCGCPRCGKPDIFPHKFTLEVKETCRNCDLKLKDHDSGDGPAVFLVFILGFLLTPLALVTDAFLPMPLWAHAIIWTIAAILICLGTMQPIKAYVIALNYKHRGGAHGV